ncbi:HAD-IA family hydrolase [Lactobacillus sp. S2-2]|uniref:HAD-IA family hydrolase n=1 Tax=Lactobacillus sp. S2-2 TaxID=2692917 RepID=UPI001F027135|nr:HAD-IA family hydrolase [Lactobacillus sp. S2-2]MCF6514968.1 HAD-IA family hydrolase [Lactobacillus sp. S2-2]
MDFDNMIWDFDGTLFNTYPQMVSAFVKALQKMKIDDVDIDPDEIYEQMRIHSLGSAINLFAARLGLDESKLKYNYQQYEVDLVQLSKPFDDIEDILKQTVDNDGKNMLLTHRNHTAINLLEKFELDKYFTDYVTSNDNFKRKPDPESLNYLVKYNQLDRYKTVMVGDRLLDVRAGENASTETILFDPDYLIEVTGNPDLIIHKFDEIKNKK